jgi:hypothetical protein
MSGTALIWIAGVSWVPNIKSTGGKRAAFFVLVAAAFYAYNYILAVFRMKTGYYPL